MSDLNKRDDTAAIQQELRQGREFSIAALISEEAGDFMKGESPVPPLVQARLEVCGFIRAQLADGSGALQIALTRWVEADDTTLSRHLEAPLEALQTLLEQILHSPASLYELVRQADVIWGQQYDERPHFQRPGQAPHPDDEYTHESVRRSLERLLERARHPG